MNFQKDIAFVEFGETETLDDRRLLIAYGRPVHGDSGWWLFWLDADSEKRSHCLPGALHDDRSQVMELARNYALENRLL
ncbi:hypothetical protein ACPXCO_07705 [Streptomyces cyaneofuscatus]|uniref:hypothetical protein n=1 Tax=Streptomyces griseus group TaxID=629295 RepID=UPI000A3C80EE|nr:hypothetical protein [Streptomyces albovinaceus]